jgi:hypothetical protein
MFVCDLYKNRKIPGTINCEPVYMPGMDDLVPAGGYSLTGITDT